MSDKIVVPSESPQGVIQKPWGEEVILFTAQFDKLENYPFPWKPVKQVKRIKIKAGERTSLQFHWDKEEYLLITKGRMSLVIGGKAFLITEGQFAYIAPATIHQFVTLTQDEGVEMIELSRGSDKDIVRLKDKYGRGELDGGRNGQAVVPIGKEV